MKRLAIAACALFAFGVQADPRDRYDPSDTSDLWIGGNENQPQTYQRVTPGTAVIVGPDGFTGMSRPATDGMDLPRDNSTPDDE